MVLYNHFGMHMHWKHMQFFIFIENATISTKKKEKSTRIILLNGLTRNNIKFSLQLSKLNHTHLWPYRTKNRNNKKCAIFLLNAKKLNSLKNIHYALLQVGTQFWEFWNPIKIWIFLYRWMIFSMRNNFYINRCKHTSINFINHNISETDLTNVIQLNIQLESS